MKEDTKTKETQAYAESIAAGLVDWQLAAEFVACHNDASTYTLADYAAEHCSQCTDIDNAFRIITDNLTSPDFLVLSVADAWDVYLQGALSVKLIGANDGSGWRVSGAEITLTFGGPSCWIEYNGSQDLAVCVSWWGDVHSASVQCSGLVDALERYVEMMEQ